MHEIDELAAVEIETHGAHEVVQQDGVDREVDLQGKIPDADLEATPDLAETTTAQLLVHGPATEALTDAPHHDLPSADDPDLTPALDDDPGRRLVFERLLGPERESALTPPTGDPEAQSERAQSRRNPRVA